MSEESLYYRSFGMPNVERMSDWSIDVDYADRYGLVVTRGATDGIIGHAAYVRTGPSSAEVAFEVADPLQGHGIATLLLAHLAEVAARNGITTFTAEVLPGNYKMTDMFRNSGFPTTLRTADGVTAVELPTSLSEETLTAFEARAQTAAIEAVRCFLAPRRWRSSAPAAGEGTVGAEILSNLISARFCGRLYPVNPHADAIGGVPAYRNVAEIPGPFELGVIVVPAALVNDVARECAAAGARALLVISAGFAEAGREGEARQRELLEICRNAGHATDRTELPRDHEPGRRCRCSTRPSPPPARPRARSAFCRRAEASASR